MYDLAKKAYNQYKIKGDTCYLTIVRRDNSKVVIELDAEDAGRVEALGTWAWHGGTSDKSYAMHSLHAKKLIQLGRFIMSTPDHLVCKYLDGNSKNCRKSNLQNVKYENLVPSNTGHPYVYWNEARQQYGTKVYDPAKRQTYHVGDFKTLEIALERQKKCLAANPKYRVPGVTP